MILIFNKKWVAKLRLAGYNDVAIMILKYNDVEISGVQLIS